MPNDAPQKRRRGRPPKVRLPDISATDLIQRPAAPTIITPISRDDAIVKVLRSGLPEWEMKRALDDILEVYGPAEKKNIAPLTYAEFVQEAWKVVEPRAPYLHNWHIDAIGEHLEAALRGEIKNLVIAMPRRCGKSQLISVLFPAWVWTLSPEKQFIFSSYSGEFAKRDSVKCRMLIQSNWYQDRWGHKVVLCRDQNEARWYSNMAGGHRIATSPGGKGVGQGGDYLICLPGDVVLTTPDGPIPIGEVVANQVVTEVLGYDHETGQTQFTAIEAYEESDEREIVTIELDGITLECTEDHPVFVVGKGYIPAGQVQSGDEVLVDD